MGEDWDYEPQPEHSVAALAEGSGRSPLEVAYDHMLTRGAKGMIWRALGAGSPVFPLLWRLILFSVVLLLVLVLVLVLLPLLASLRPL